jgi:hypothetical protein
VCGFVHCFLLQPEELIEETCLMQDGHERGFDQHGIAKEVRSKLDMASLWQCRPLVNHHHEVVQTKTVIIGAQISSSSPISTALFYSHSKHYFNLLPTSQTLHKANFETFQLQNV